MVWVDAIANQMKSDMQDVQVGNQILIAGAGPSGLALAAELSRRGVSAAIIDRQAAGANASRACVVHARTMEALEPLGVTRDLLAEGVKVPIFRIRDRDRLLLTINFSEIPSSYQFTLMIPQNRIEQILLRHLKDLGRSVMRPCELIRYSTPSQIEAEVRINSSIRSIKAQWLIGCDGMHSTVREQSGITFAGGEYEASFVLADVRMEWPLSREEVTLFYSPKGFVVVAPLPNNRFRIVATAEEAPEFRRWNSCRRCLMRVVRRPIQGVYTTWHGARASTSIIGSQTPRAKAGSCFVAMPRTFTAPRAARA